MMKSIRGLIRYVCPVDTLAPPLGSIFNVADSAFPLRSITPAGELQEIYLPLYQAYNKTFKDDVVVNNSRGSATTMPVHETIFHNSQDIFLFTVNGIPEFYAQPDLVDTKAVYDAMIQAAIQGVKITFYPDINNKPNEVYTCAMPKRALEKREGNKLLYTLKFNLEHVDGTALPTVPGFAA